MVPNLMRSKAHIEIPINPVVSSKFGIYSRVSPEKAINMYQSDNALVSYPGYKKTIQLGVKNVDDSRASFFSVRGNFAVVVVGNEVKTISTHKNVEVVGTMDSSSGECFIDENLDAQICIVDGKNAYIYQYNATRFGGQYFAKVVFRDNMGTPMDPQPLPTYVSYHNTFFNFGTANFNKPGAPWYSYRFDPSDLNTQGTLIQWASEQLLQTKPDYPLAVLRIPGQGGNVLVLGTSVCEIFTQVGGQLNYRRNNTISVDYGCVNVNTIDTSDNYIAWLGINERNAPVIMVYSGQDIAPISTDGIDRLMEQIKFPELSTSTFCTINGHLIYQLTFTHPQDNLTVAYDFTVQKFLNLTDEKRNFHPALSYIYLGGSTYFLSLTEPALYEFSTDYTVIDQNLGMPDTTDYDERLVYLIPRCAVTENYQLPNADRFRVNYLTLNMEQGCDPYVSEASLGVIRPIFTEDGIPILNEAGVPVVDESSWGGGSAYVAPYQPIVELKISVDGGVTWSPSVRSELHPIGWRKNILNWNKLGQANIVAFQWWFWTKSRVVVNSASMEVMT